MIDLNDLIWGHSKALYSTWMLYRPDHLLIDCGEGAATSLGNGGYFIERVLLTHGHSDHISGLPSLLWSRAAGMGDTDKPLQIFYPQDDELVADMRHYLARSVARMPFELTWTPLRASERIALPTPSGSRHARFVETFATRHINGRLTLGYKIVETRRRLKTEFAHLSQAEIGAVARSQGRDAVQDLMESFDAIVAAWSGDSMPIDPENIRNAELLAHDATLIDGADRQQRTHSTLDEAIGVAMRAQAKTLLLYHVSGRYRAAEVRAAIEKSARRHNVEFPIWCLWRDQLWQGWPLAARDSTDRNARPRRRRLLIAQHDVENDSTSRTVEERAVNSDSSTNGESVQGEKSC